jgi:hypothetical protein
MNWLDEAIKYLQKLQEEGGFEIESFQGDRPPVIDEEAPLRPDYDPRWKYRKPGPKVYITIVLDKGNR